MCFVLFFQFVFCVVFQFVFEGIIGASYRGDIAIDDITVNDGPCPATGITQFLPFVLLFFKNPSPFFELANW